MYKPLTPELRRQINEFFDEQIAELQTCESNVFTTLQLEGIRAYKKLFNSLPDGYPVPIKRCEK